MRKLWVAGIVAGGMLFAAGGAVAASRYLITSTRQIKPSVLRQLRGNTGPAGPQGAQGPAGAVSGESEVTGALTEISPGSPVSSSEASCPGGQLVLSGGWKGDLVEATISSSEPATINGQQSWAVVVALDPSASSEESFQAVAVCAS